LLLTKIAQKIENREAWRTHIEQIKTRLQKKTAECFWSEIFIVCKGSVIDILEQIVLLL